MSCRTASDGSRELCYVLVTSQPLPWQQAEDACADNHHGNLVTILDASTDTFVAEMLEEYVSMFGSDPGDVWIGARREDTGKWRRLSGTYLIIKRFFYLF